MLQVLEKNQRKLEWKYTGKDFLMQTEEAGGQKHVRI